MGFNSGFKGLKYFRYIAWSQCTVYIAIRGFSLVH